MKKQLALLGLLCIVHNPTSIWCFSHDDIKALLAQHSPESSWTQDPKMVVLIGLSMVAGVSILWWMIDALRSPSRKPTEEKQEQAPETRPFTSITPVNTHNFPRTFERDEQYATERQLMGANVQIAGAIGSTGMQLLGQIETKLQNNKNELLSTIKQLFDTQAANMQQDFKNIKTKLKTIDERLAKVENKVNELGSKSQLPPEKSKR